MKLNTTFLPKYAEEEARDIMNELSENVQECQKRLQTDHLLWQYKVCIYQHLDSTDNQIWDLKNKIRYDSSESDDNDSQSTTLRAFLSLLIFNLIILSCFSGIIKSN